MDGSELRRKLGVLSGYTVTRYPMPGTLEHHMRVIFSTFEFDLLVDVGAHTGEFAERARQAGFDGQIVSFEPAPRQELLDAVNRDDRWSYREQACSSHNGTATLHQYESSAFNSLQESAAAMDARFGLAAVCAVEVPTVRLDEAGLEGHSIYLKTDAQGHDARVIEGALGILDRVQAIQIELAVTPIYEGTPLMPEVMARLLELGYEPSGLFPVSRARDHLRVIEFDGVLLKRPGV